VDDVSSVERDVDLLGDVDEDVVTAGVIGPVTVYKRAINCQVNKANAALCRSSSSSSYSLTQKTVKLQLLLQYSIDQYSLRI